MVKQLYSNKKAERQRRVDSSDTANSRNQIRRRARNIVWLDNIGPDAFIRSYWIKVILLRVLKPCNEKLGAE